MVDPKPDLSPRQTFKPYPVDAITQHIPPGTRILDGKYPLLSGLEHDEMGHPTGSPKLHMVMTAKRRNKLRKLAEEIPVPEIYGDEEGDVLLVGWGSTYGPIHDAVKQARDHGEKVGARSGAARSRIGSRRTGVLVRNDEARDRRLRPKLDEY